MATNEKKEQENKVETEQKETTQTQVMPAEEKKGFWKNLGKGAKAAICGAAALGLAGAAFLVAHLLGGNDEDGDDAVVTTEGTVE